MGITPRPSVSGFSVKTPIDGSRRGRAIVFWPLRRWTNFVSCPDIRLCWSLIAPSCRPASL